ncbi:MAG: C1 family peptidase [Candidatus Aminicenantales bacterium]
MAKIIQRALILGVLGFALLGGPQAQENRSDASRATGLIPLDAAQIEAIVSNWPRITRVGINPLGYERVNEVRAGKGKSPLDPLSIAPIGAEVESSLAAHAASTQAASANAALAGDLPVSVDNSQLRFFPPIRNQGSLGSCASFSSTYVQLSYMTAFQRNLDIRDSADNTNKYSPKWSYNMLNDGSNNGSSLYQNYALLNRNGAATWAEFPYDANYLAWCLNPAAWRNALSVRTKVTQYVRDASTAVGTELVKELLADGYVVVFGTYITSWVFKPAQDDASTSADDAAVGKSVAFWLNGSEGSHAMTIVGYNDAVWTDINANSVIDPGEKGAFRIANTWGPGWYESGFTWLAYDALKSISAVTDGPSTSRVAAIQGDLIYVLTARNGYAPKMIGEFTVDHAKRNQLTFTLGRSSPSTALPTTVWTPSAFQHQGGAFAFDGSSTSVSGTFVLDFTDILVQGAGLQRYYLGVNDSAAGDAATLSAFKIVDLTTDPNAENATSLVPQTADSQQIYAYVDYTYPGPAYNDPPQLSSPQVSPVTGTAGGTFTFNVRYTDQDGDVPTVKNLILDGTPRAVNLLSGQQPADGWYSTAVVLAAGPHSYAFYFEDGRGESAQAPLAGTFGGPAVFGHMITSLTPSSAATGAPAFALVVNGSDFVNGAVVTWEGVDRPTTFVSSSRVDAAIPLTDLTVGKTIPVVVRNPSGVLSNVQTFSVNNPWPALTSVSPTWASGGGTDLTLTLRGSGFVTNSKARWNGIDLATTYSNPTEVRASLTSQDLAQAGDFEVSVDNPFPGGGDTESIVFSLSDFTMNVPPSEVTVAAGHSATYSLEVSPRYGSFDSAVAFKCTGLPKGCTASFSPANVTPGASPVTVTLTLATKAPQSSAGTTAFGPINPVPPAAGLLLLAAIVTAVALVRRTAVGWPGRRRAAAAAALVLMTVWLAGCGAGGNVNTPDPGTPAGTYQVGIQATSGSLTVQSSVTLIVN